MPPPLNQEPHEFDDPSEYHDLAAAADWSHVRELAHGLRALQRLRPVLLDGQVHILPLSREGYEKRALSRIRGDPDLYRVTASLFPKNEQRSITGFRRDHWKKVGRPWTEYDETGWIEFGASFGMVPLLNYFIAAMVALEIEADPRLDAQVMSPAARVIAAIVEVADVMAAYWKAGMRLKKRSRLGSEVERRLAASLGTVEAESSIDTLATLLRMEVPRLDGLSYVDLATARSSEPGLAAFRAALRRGLAEAGRAPDTGEWRSYAQLVVEEEMATARVDLEEKIRHSRLLSQVAAGSRALLVSAVGATAGWAVGGKPAAALVGSGATAGMSTLLAMISSVRQRNGYRALLSHYVGFDDADAPRPRMDDLDFFSRRSVSRIDLLPW